MGFNYFETPLDNPNSDCFCGKLRTRTVRIPIRGYHMQRGICERHYLAYTENLYSWFASQRGC